MPILDKPKSGLSFKSLKNDIPAGLVVFFVALPLCLGIALASEAPLFAGIIAGIVGGLLVGFASGSPISVTGPAAGLTVIVINSIEQLGSFEAFLLAVVIAGLMQILLGFLKAGIIGYYFPSSVIKGMLAAIGIILILKQIPHALGYDKDTEGDFNFHQADGANTFSEIANAINHPQTGAIIIALVSLAILILWERPNVKKFSFFRLVPGALILVVAGVVINEIFRISFPGLQLTGDALVLLPVSGSVSGFLDQFTAPDFSAFTNYQVYVVAVTIAIIASLETLLCIEAADKLDPYKRTTPTNRELKAQGLGNMFSGLIGGLPLTAVIVRTSANVSAGAKTKMATIIHAVFLLLSVIALAPIMNKIPLACLAGLLLMLGYKLAKISLFKQMYHLGWSQFMPFIVTIVAIQFSDLLKGIAVGMCMALFYILRNNYRHAYFSSKEEHHEGERIVIQLADDVTFLNKGSIIQALSDLPDKCTVVLDGSKSRHIDLDVIETIHEFRDYTAPLKSIVVEFKNIPEFKRGAAR